jgi:peptide deformylase
MIYPIIVYGNPVLRKRAEEIAHNGFNVATLAADMYETMYSAHGIGLAAPQIGKSMRMFVVDGTTLEDEPKLKDFKQVFINPVMLEEYSEPWDFEEGCLSIPNIREKITRKAKIRIRYFDVQWMLHEEELDGMKARIVQHEYDHLEGKLFLDYLSPLKKRMLKGKLTDISKGEVETEYRILAPLKK